MKLLKQSLLAVVLAAGATLAAAQVPSYGANVTIDQTKKIAAASIAYAQKNKWPVAVAIVDNGGMLRYYEMMEDTQTASATIAVEKAKTAAMFRRPTRAFEAGVAKGRNAILGLPGVTPITGGVPIVVNGKILGAVGVSGVTSDQDEEIAKAGLSGL